MRCGCAEGMANQQSAAAYAAAVSGLYQKKVTLKRDDMLLVRWATKETSENGNINLEGITSDLGKRLYDSIYDMYLDEFEDYEEGSGMNRLN